MKLSAEQAHYVLDSLVAKGRVRWAQVEKVLRGRLEEIRHLRERLASLEGLADRAAGGLRRRAARKVARKAPRRALSSKTRALRRLQGKYMGHVRNLRVADKARVKALRKKQGIGPAIKLAVSLGSK